MIPMMFLVSIVCFTIVELQPGDYVSQFLNNPDISTEQIQMIRQQLSLDKSPVERYGMWIGGIVTRGDFGYSFAYKRPVIDLIGERMGWTVGLALLAIVFQWALAVPLGVYSARKPRSLGDYGLTGFALFGLSVPDFFLAIIIMFLMVSCGATSVGGLFSNEFVGAPMSWAKFLDLLGHIWVPIIVIGFAGVASLMRVMRSNYLDVEGAPFVESLRARGLSERQVSNRVLKNALNPMVSLAGAQLPEIFSGTITASIVLALPTMGPFFYDALLNGDQYLVMGFLMLIAFITQIGNLLADVALALLDPRIRMS
jgi:ABC-type dipeptide/oligopeptide/nickel transport systems, permease components